MLVGWLDWLGKLNFQSFYFLQNHLVDMLTCIQLFFSIHEPPSILRGYNVHFILIQFIFATDIYSFHFQQLDNSN